MILEKCTRTSEAFLSLGWPLLFFPWRQLLSTKCCDISGKLPGLLSQAKADYADLTFGMAIQQKIQTIPNLFHNLL